MAKILKLKSISSRVRSLSVLNMAKVAGVILLGSFILGGLLCFGARYIRYDEGTSKFKIGDNAEITGNLNVNGKISGDGSGLTNISAQDADDYVSKAGSANSAGNADTVDSHHYSSNWEKPSFECTTIKASWQNYNGRWSNFAVCPSGYLRTSCSGGDVDDRGPWDSNDVHLCYPYTGTDEACLINTSFDYDCYAICCRLK